MKTKVGFTGTQVGMSDKQKLAVRAQLISMDPDEFHHGDCIGADKEAHDIAVSLGIKTVIHPPKNNSKRAFCTGDVVLPAGDYLDRNRDIVNSVNVMIATPKEEAEQLRSGTWATIRYAKKVLKSPLVIFP
jgi:hypothetical protein